MRSWASEMADEAEDRGRSSAWAHYPLPNSEVHQSDGGRWKVSRLLLKMCPWRGDVTGGRGRQPDAQELMEELGVAHRGNPLCMWSTYHLRAPLKGGICSRDGESAHQDGCASHQDLSCASSPPSLSSPLEDPEPAVNQSRGRGSLIVRKSMAFFAASIIAFWP